MSDKSGWEGRSQQFWDSRWGRQGPVPSPWTPPKRNSALEPLEGCIAWGCWELKRKFPVRGFRVLHVAPWFWFAAITLIAWGIVGLLQKLSTNYISAESSLIWLVVGFLLLVSRNI